MKCIATFLLFFLISFIRVNAQNISNEGTEFWLCFPSHVPAQGQGNSIASLSVFVTSKDNTSGVVTCGTFSQSFTVLANTVTEVVVSRAASYINDGTGISTNKGIKVTIDNGKPKAVVYAHVFAGARSAATLVLPVLALGQKYYGMSFDQNDTRNIGNSQLNIVCVEPNTVLNITPRISGVPQPTIRVTLVNVGDVYQYQNENDITGTYVEVDASSSSCKRFAAFSGSSAVAILAPGCTPPGSATNTGQNASYDPLFQQLYPLESWGTSFPLIPFSERNTGSIFRVMASENNTIINIAGVTRTINAGEFYQSPPITSVSLITANKPVTVAQFALTQYCADSRNRTNGSIPSDPDMVIVNPLEYSIKNVTMYSSDKLVIRDQFLNVMIPNAGVASFKINGQVSSNIFSAVPGNTNYSYAQIDLNRIGGTNFNLTSDVGFNAMAYGFGDFESYAYSAGTNLASSVFINAVRPETNEIITNACRDEVFDFRLVLPYISNKLVWTLDVGETPIVQNNLTPVQITINGKVLFEYRLPVNKIYSVTGIKKIKVISTIPPGASGCPSGDETLNFDFEVYDPPPNTSFLAKNSACINNPVQYNLNESSGGRPIISYFWDFGDGSTSTEKNPIHTFTTTGIKSVSLFVKNDVACVSNVFTLPIEILNQPQANFLIEDLSCSQQPIKFTDQSDLAQSTAMSYLWDFGDGTTSAEQNPVHAYSTSGNYVVSLTVKTSADCEVTITKSKIINGAPTIDFDDPASCVTDLVTFTVKNKSADVASFDWDFGDAVNDVSQRNKENPSHKYNNAGFYNVKLTVTSVNGCTTEVIKSITISAANPKAQFAVLDNNNLCSNVPVKFKDLSSISFGNITKLEWIFNYSATAINQKLVVNNPVPQDTYEFKYPASKDNLNYQVTLRAYSGNLCFQDFGPVTVTVKGSPDVNFAPLPNVCLNINKFKFTEASELTGIAGSGFYTGTGITDDGFFDPLLSGAGTFEISYIFNANNGCTDIKKQNITVYELPVIVTGTEELVILTGGQITLNAEATGNGLTYKWLPADGLSRDDILNPIASPQETTLYTLTVTSADGCIVIARVNVNVADFPDIPNTFTPNNDAVNDTWNIKYLDTYVNAKVSIFNRFGNEVFSSNGYPIPWDGKLKGKDVPVGVYYYVIDPRNGNDKFSGSVTVIR
ncbi:PKD domain-containing protein [Pedobacter cryophilus]|uniref:PKD domain-containing protein n=1 Tax=Pedobacter cryophilus TaxID=2571271 RepID=A0A4U1C1Y2_9SPHI|nr:PKD domain-containing protein [Pedobacter cryophilus]TKB99007.1 PKD domain-containing protein [Pedobacter cryophilus]